MEETTSEADKTLSKQGWDTKKVGISCAKVYLFCFLNVFSSMNVLNIVNKSKVLREIRD